LLYSNILFELSTSLSPIEPNIAIFYEVVSPKNTRKGVLEFIPPTDKTEFIKDSPTVVDQPEDPKPNL